MKKSLVIAACAGLLLLSACSGQRPTRCNQWGWYEPCDLIEGQQSDKCCPSPCDPGQSPRRGQVVSREFAFPAQPCQPGDVVNVAPAAAPMAAPAPAPMAAPMAAPEVPPTN